MYSAPLRPGCWNTTSMGSPRTIGRVVSTPTPPVEMFRRKPPRLCTDVVPLVKLFTLHAAISGWRSRLRWVTNFFGVSRFRSSAMRRKTASGTSGASSSSSSDGTDGMSSVVIESGASAVQKQQRSFPSTLAWYMSESAVANHSCGVAPVTGWPHTHPMLPVITRPLSASLSRRICPTISAAVSRAARSVTSGNMSTNSSPPYRATTPPLTLARLSVSATRCSALSPA